MLNVAREGAVARRNTRHQAPTDLHGVADGPQQVRQLRNLEVLEYVERIDDVDRPGGGDGTQRHVVPVDVEAFLLPTLHQRRTGFDTQVGGAAAHRPPRERPVAVPDLKDPHSGAQRHAATAQLGREICALRSTTCTEIRRSPSFPVRVASVRHRFSGACGRRRSNRILTTSTISRARDGIE